MNADIIYNSITMKLNPQGAIKRYFHIASLLISMSSKAVVLIYYYII
ncbi:uncharacterized protein METZ01_LOCUS285401 [marine metagenome]|uniref:Uncharacterized protein n=1 Tax=marine metagenome TaxID=408172 RepID=A0A382LBS0_9ZZZZ